MSIKAILRNCVRRMPKAYDPCILVLNPTTLVFPHLESVALCVYADEMRRIAGTLNVLAQMHLKLHVRYAGIFVCTACNAVLNDGERYPWEYAVVE